MLTSGVFGYLADYLLWWLLLISILVHTWCFFRFFPKKCCPKTRLVMGNGLVFLSLLGVTALVAESYIRFTVVETDAFGVSLPARRWFAMYTKLNEMGCRDKDWSVDKPEGVRRIAFVGDSFAYGWGINNVADRFTDIIQARLNQQRPHRTEVMNVAKPGWGTQQQVEPIEDMIDRYHVDEIVLCYVPNDIEKLLPTTPDFNPTKPPTSGFFNLDSSCLLDYLYRRVWLPRLPTVRVYHDWLAQGYTDPQVWSLQQQQLEIIAQYCRQHNVTLRVVLLPFIMTGGREYNAPALHQALTNFFNEIGVDVLDLLPLLANVDRKSLIVNQLDPHPNEKAHAMFADAIWKAFYKNQPSQ